MNMQGLIIIITSHRHMYVFVSICAFLTRSCRMLMLIISNHIHHYRKLYYYYCQYYCCFYHFMLLLQLLSSHGSANIFCNNLNNSPPFPVGEKGGGICVLPPCFSHASICREKRNHMSFALSPWFCGCFFFFFFLFVYIWLLYMVVYHNILYIRVLRNFVYNFQSIQHLASVLLAFLL